MTLWRTEPVGAVCVSTEQRDPREDPAVEFRYVDISGIDRNRKTIAESHTLVGAKAPSRARKVIRKDDVLVSTVRPNLNAVAMVPEELDGEIASTGFCVLRAARGLVEPRYLFYRTISADFVRALVSKVRGANYPAVSDRDIRDLEIPVPPLSEQRRIVKIFDQADQLRRLRGEADAKAGCVLPALFLKMFGDPMTNPMAWPVKRFDDICESRLGKMLDAKQQTGTHRRPYLRNANVYWDRLVLDDLLEMDFRESEQEQFRLKEGDVLICEGGEVGRAAIWNGELPNCYFQKALHRARPLPDAAVSEFVVYLLWELARRGALRGATSQATFSHLTGVKLKALRVPVPPFSLQQEFADKARLLRARVNRRGAASRLDLLFKTLLNGAFSGSLTASWREACRKGSESPDEAPTSSKRYCSAPRRAQPA